ncbi:unnamed protein product [Spirodela intermedia]|uniref:AMP-activated protein kinase glycogen-binding domain-containing protein n=1 Tax=Spirodela intermedia TaxID=51605 RepID=A0A7I8KDY0_SPIIN|nr:unnamed protein product [Spirodela intermedia]
MEQGRNGNLGCWWRTADSAWCRGTGGGEMEPEQNERILALEAEIYDFMEESSKPNCFPTKKELVAAMRMDLVEAIIDHGGWLVYGWDLDDSVDGRQSSFEELNKLSDDLEFKETEIANVQDKVRSIKAKLSALEGKIALRSIEATKILGEKQKRIDAVQRVLGLLSTAYIVWSGSASEVFLAGSFDGWATQRRMEKSSTGIFTLYLKLYPGQYEIKFIVDGVWMVDTRRPIVHHSGFENNLLTVR